MFVISVLCAEVRVGVSSVKRLGAAGREMKKTNRLNLLFQFTDISKTNHHNDGG